MKKFVLGLLMCLLLISAAHAQGASLLEHGDAFFAADLVPVGDTLYMLAEQGNGEMTIASWQNGQEAPSAAQTPVNYALYMQLSDAVPVDDGSRIVTMLFTDGSRLMSFDPVLGVVFELRMEGGNIVYSDVAAVHEPDALYWDAYGYAKSLIHAAVGGDTLYWLAAEWDDNGVQCNTIHTVDLTNGAVSQLPLQGVTDFELLPGGGLLVLQDASTLVLYDPVTGLFQSAEAQLLTEVYDILYAPAVDAAIYLENQRVMGLSGLQTVTQYAYLPVEPIDAAIMGDCIAVTDGTTTVLRELTADYQPAHELTVMSGGYENYAAVLRFSADYPDTAVYWYQDYSGYLFDNSYEALVPMLAEQQLDIAVVTINASGFDALVQGGYAADLSGYDALTARLNAMYPAYRDAVSSGGGYAAVPLGASSWGWYYDPFVLSKTGLTAAELPTNMIDLCAFITRWNNELMALYPDVSLFAYVENTRSYILGAMLEQYGVWCEKQYGTLTFDTPEFRSLLAAVDAMECDRIDRAAAERFYEGGLIGNDFAAAGSFAWSVAEQYGTAAWLPMSLTAETERVEPVALEVAFVNAACDDLDAAAQLLTYMLDAMSAEAAHTLFADETEPVANPDYAAWLAESNAYLNQLLAERAAAGDRAGEYDEIIDAQRYYIENELPLTEWSISAEDIAFYQTNIAPYARVIRASCISNWPSASYTACYELVERHVRGEITQEQLIRELDAIP